MAPHIQSQLCTPLQCGHDLMGFAHDSKVESHLSFSKRLARLSEFHGKHNAKRVMKYCDRCVMGQQQENSQGQVLNDPTAVRVPTRSWGIVAR